MDFLLEAWIECPWCGEGYSLMVDTSQGPLDTIEDCTVCCRPIHVDIQCEAGSIISLQCNRE